MWSQRLTPKQQSQLLIEYLRGEPVKKLAAKYNCHHSYPALLARRRGKPTRSGKHNIRYERTDDEL